MVLDTLLSATSVALTGLEYNRDGFSDNVAMRQNQIYQEKNYHITWIAAVREEVRDIMTIFVGRMSNCNVVSSLSGAIVAGAILEGTVADSCPDFVAHSFCISMYISGMYLVMAVMNATGGMNVAYKSGMAFLVAVVPDPLDSYSHDYMQQVTRDFERDARRVFRPPLYDLVAGWRGGGPGKKPRGAAAAAAAAASHAPPELEQLPRGLGGPPGTPALRSSAAASSQPAAGAMPRAGGCRRDDGRVSAVSYFHTLRMYSELWEPFAVAADESLMHGIVSFAHGSTYYGLGRLYDRSERWAALTVLAMFIVLLAALFSSPGTRGILGRSACQGEDAHERTREDLEEARDLGPRRRRGRCDSLLLVLLVSGPAACAVADRAALPWMDAVFVPLSYFFHVCLSLAFSVTAFRWSSCYGAQCIAAAPAVGASSTGPNGKEERDTAHATRVPSPGSACNEAVREDPEVLLMDLLERSRHEIRTTLRTTRVSTGLVHGIAALAWLSMFGWSLAVHVRSSESFWPLVDVEDVRVEWPSWHFRPHALACTKEHVFIADRFGIYELQGGALQPLACDLAQPATDLAASCQGPHCWPLVLANGSPSSVVNCISGDSATLSQMPSTVERLVTLGDGAVAVLQSHELMYYRWAADRKAFHPQGPLADVDGDGLRAVDLVQDAGGGSHLLLFRGAAAQGSAAPEPEQGHGRVGRRAEAVLEVAALDSAPSNHAPSPARAHFRLPHHLPPLRGGCASDDGSSVLVLLQGEGTRPQLGRLRLNVSSGALL